MEIDMFFQVMISVLIGGAIGFLYYKVVGCPNGSCPITAKPMNTIIYGAVVGLLVGLI
jgi:hypothetical protein